MLVVDFVPFAGLNIPKIVTKAHRQVTNIGLHFIANVLAAI